MFRLANFRPLVLLSSTLLPFAALTGCGVGTAGSNAGSASAASSAVKEGHVHGGNQPVTLATVTMYTANPSSYGGAATQIYQTTTDLSGNFTLSPLGVKGYACHNGDLDYLVSTGGNPGLQPVTTNNTNLVLIAALGPCAALTTSTNIDINEVSTAAAVYALAPFFSTAKTATGAYNPAALGTSSTNSVGLVNAFATVNNLVSLGTGTALAATPAGNGLPEQTLLNSIANFLSICGNSNGSDGNCTMAANAAQSSAPDTFSDMMTIALAPYNNVSAILSLAAGIAPFQPAYSGTTRNDLSMSIGYQGAGANPTETQVDAAGNVWVASAAGLQQFSPLGAYLGTTSTPVSASCFRIAGNGTIFVADNAASVTRILSSAGVLLQSVAGGGTNGGADGCSTDSLNNFDYGSGQAINNVSAGGTKNSSVLNYNLNGSIAAPYSVAADQSSNFVYTANYTYYLGTNECALEGLVQVPSTSPTYGATSPYGGCSASSLNQVPLRFPTWNGMNSFLTLFVRVVVGTGQTGGLKIETFNPFSSGFESADFSLTQNTAAGGAGISGGMSIDGAEHVFLISKNVVGVFSAVNTSSTGTAGVPAVTVVAPNGLIPDSFVTQTSTSNASQTQMPLINAQGNLDASGNFWFPLNSVVSGQPEFVEIVGIGAPTVMPFGQQAVKATTGQRP